MTVLNVQGNYDPNVISPDLITTLHARNKVNTATGFSKDLYGAFNGEFSGTGNNLTYDANGMLSGGDLTTFTMRLDGQATVSASDFDVSAAQAGSWFDLINDHDARDTLLQNSSDLITFDQNVASNDAVAGLDGDDSIVGGAGNDTLLGNTGDDVLLGNTGDDQLYGGQGDDKLVGGQQNDIVVGNQGDDVLLGNQGNDTLFGGVGNDTLFGGQGNDLLWGGQGNDLLYGNEGKNTFGFNPGDTGFLSGVGTGDTIGDFKTGSDHIDFASGSAGSAQNFGATSTTSTDFASIQAQAQKLINGGDTYAFVADGVDGYLFTTGGNGATIQDAVKLAGAGTIDSLHAQDIVNSAPA